MTKFKNSKKGFSLVELIVVVAIMAVLTGVLIPALIGYVEDTRAKKDTANMQEIVTAVEAALADYDVYNEVVLYSTDVPDGYVVTQKEVNGKWSTNNMNGLTITFYSDERQNLDGATISISNAITNKGLSATKGGRQVGNVWLTNLSNGDTDANLYRKIVQVVGDKIELESKTYRNSNYTVFIKLGDASNTTEVYGQWNGEKLTKSVGPNAD